MVTKMEHGRGIIQMRMRLKKLINNVRTGKKSMIVKDEYVKNARKAVKVEHKAVKVEHKAERQIE